MDDNKNNKVPLLAKRWVIADPVPLQIRDELKDFSPLLQQLLFNRGISSAEEAYAFTEGKCIIDSDPFLIKDMDKAVSLLHEAVLNKSKIAVYGDYDADGVTASALMSEFLSSIGCQPRIYIPNRFDEGYGLNVDAIDQLAGEGIKLLITVDCGVRSTVEIQHARDCGMQVILTDHHLPGDILPPADAIINPRQQGDTYGEKSLAGVGLAFKLAQGYLKLYPNGFLQPNVWLDLVAIGTIADLAPLIGENRSLTKAGLEQLKKQTRQGLYSLAQVAGINLERVNAGTIGFVIAPRLNAAGRVESAQTSFELLITKDVIEAGQLAQKIEVQNAERQAMTQQIKSAVTKMALEKDVTAPIIFAASPTFSEGVVGLAASQIVELLYRPAIIGHQTDTHTIASCRSIAEFNITEALDQCEDLLVRYGGHSMAAGLTVENEKLNILLEKLESLASEQFRDTDLMPVLNIDREIKLEKLSSITIPGIFKDLATIEPTGNCNPEAIFCSYNCKVVYAKKVGSQGSHLKLNLRAGNNLFDAIAFRQAHVFDGLPDEIDIAYTFEINEYMGRQSTQLNIKDIKPSSGI